MSLNWGFRWFGESDPVSLVKVKQIPGVTNIVSALHNIEPGTAWPEESLKMLRDQIELHQFKFEVVECIPLHEEIKLGGANRDRFVDLYLDSLRAVSNIGCRVVCYNFMPILDWMRTSSNQILADGSNTLAYSHDEFAEIADYSSMALPGWFDSADSGVFKKLVGQYERLGKSGLWENLEYFLRKVVPVAEELNIKLALHPDDPPWDLGPIPRIINNIESIQRVLDMVDSRSNAFCFCCGSLGADPDNNLVAILESILLRNRLSFAHFRNLKRTGNRSFVETAHFRNCGDIDLAQLLEILVSHDYTGSIRPDHGRMIWEESGKPGYGLYDRAIGLSYMTGVVHGIKLNYA